MYREPVQLEEINMTKYIHFYTEHAQRAGASASVAL
jgi:hypothetical protein